MVPVVPDRIRVCARMSGLGFGMFEAVDYVAAEENPCRSADGGQEDEADENECFRRFAGTQRHRGGLEYGIDRRNLLHLGFGCLETL